MFEIGLSHYLSVAAILYFAGVLLVAHTQP